MILSTEFSRYLISTRFVKTLHGNDKRAIASTLYSRSAKIIILQQLTSIQTPLKSRCTNNPKTFEDNLNRGDRLNSREQRKSSLHGTGRWTRRWYVTVSPVVNIRKGSLSHQVRDTGLVLYIDMWVLVEVTLTKRCGSCVEAKMMSWTI